MGVRLEVNEQTAVLGAGPQGNGYDDQIGIYDPFSDRMFPQWGCETSSIALRTIKAGEEVRRNHVLIHIIRTGLLIRVF